MKKEMKIIMAFIVCLGLLAMPSYQVFAQTAMGGGPGSGGMGPHHGGGGGHHESSDKCGDAEEDLAWALVAEAAACSAGPLDAFGCAAASAYAYRQLMKVTEYC